jgi:hypothetical protein
MEMISTDARVLRYLRWWRHSLVSCTTLATWEDDEDCLISAGCGLLAAVEQRVGK